MPFSAAPAKRSSGSPGARDTESPEPAGEKPVEVRKVDEDRGVRTFPPGAPDERVAGGDERRKFFKDLRNPDDREALRRHDHRESRGREARPSHARRGE